MKGEEKSKDQLLCELNELREKIAGLEAGRKLPDGGLFWNESLPDSLINSLPGLFYLFDEQGVFHRWNRNLETVTGYSGEEIAGMSPLDFFEGEDRELIAENIKKAFRYGDSKAEASLVARSGEKTPYFFTGLRTEVGDKKFISGMGIDISDLKRAKAALRESEEKYRSIYDNAQVGLYRSRIEDGKILECNDRFAQILGYPDSETCIRDCIASTHYLDPKRRGQMIEEMQKAGEINNFEARGFKKDGSTIWVRYSGRIYPERGYLEGVLADITEQRKFERELARERAALENIFSLNPYAISIYDAQGRFIRGNEAYFNLFKSSPSPEYSIFNDPILKEHGYGDEVMKLRDGQVISVPEIWYNPRILYPGYPDNPIYVRGMAFPVMDRDEEVDFIVVIHENFTEKKLAEEDLRSSEERFRLLLSNIPAVVYVGYDDWTVDFFDEGIKELTGYEKEEFDSRRIKWSDLVLKEDLKIAKQSFVRALRGDGSYVREYRISDRSGKILWIQERGKIALDEKGRIKNINGVFYDVTERMMAVKEKKRLESQLIHAQKMEAVGTLAGGIAHDFNNLLQAIQGFGDLLLLDRRADEPGYQELLEIVRAAKRGGELTRQLLTFSRKVESKRRPIDLNNKVKIVGKILKRTIPKMIKIQLDLERQPKVVNADPIQIEQVLMNLAVNAKDAMPDGGTLTISTGNVTLGEEFGGRFQGEHVLLSISDTGHGIDKASLEHIFDPFYSTKEVGRGTGLGLSMVYGIVKSHDGHITCSSEPGKGTTFMIYLPAHGFMEEPGRGEEAGELERGTETVLLVDDEKNVRDLGERTLTRFGYTVYTADRGETALEIYREKWAEIDLVILDLIMPGMGGGKCLEELMGINPRAKVLIVSGYAPGVPTKDVVSAKAKGFIRKPYETAKMLKTVRETLDEE